jgi:hypothetical protein
MKLQVLNCESFAHAHAGVYEQHADDFPLGD